MGEPNGNTPISQYVPLTKDTTVRSHSKGGLGRSAVVLAASALVVAPLAISMPASAQEPIDIDSGETKTYIVQLKADPVAAYTGGIRGLAATKPDQGEKVQAESTAAAEYETYLSSQQDKALATVGLDGDDKIYEYTVAFNGFAAEMTASQAARLAKASGVVNIWENEIRQPDTITTPDYLGLTGSDGVWNTYFEGQENAGSGMVIGMIDSGIWPENPAFGPLPAGTPIPETFDGVCDEGADTEENNFECNNKVIGARYYPEGNTVIEAEFLSPRDYGGHGSHTSSTAAGNFGVDVEILGIELGTMSGMAPAAQISNYKVCWEEEGCGSVGLIAAIDDATADGVDVINYSISGSSTSIIDPVEIAFLFAADAGVFVSTSAGNSGDTVGESSVAHNAPWTMTVAASTHDRNVNKEVTLGNGETYPGVGVDEAVEGPLVSAADAALTGVSAQAARECWLDADNDASNGQQPTLDPAVVAGNIVICDRGTVARTDKSAAVAQAEGIGMIQTNTTDAQSLNADFHAVPSIHVSATNGAPIKEYEATAEAPTAAISAPGVGEVIAPEMAGFSSFGPALAGGGDLLKPDITAPGVDVIAAVAPPGNGGLDFNSYSGTSMSAPHIAGLALLMAQENPEWSVAATKSAMMTTASPLNNVGEPIQRSGADATALDYGSGEVRAGDAYGPGLVYDADSGDYLDYICAVGQDEVFVDGFCDDVTMDASDLNYPSIAIGDLAGTQTVTRTVTNVSDTTETYVADVEAPEGITAVATPATFTVAPGESATYEIEIARTTAPLNEYTFGEIVLESDSFSVRSPIAVQPVAIAAPEEITGTGMSGEQDVEVTPGFTGVLNTDVDGLVPSQVQVQDVPTGDTIADAIYPYTVPEGSKTVRFAIYDSEVGDGTDVDLYVVNAANEIIALSADASSEESVTLDGLAAGNYRVLIDVFSGPDPLTVPVHGFIVTETDEGNLTVTPESSPVIQGETETLNVAWDDLEANSRYLGAVNYLEGDTAAGRTLVSIETGPWTAVERIGGANRFETAALIAAEYPEGVDTVFIASGEKFPDALSASAPASGSVVPGTMENSAVAAPVLLTRVDALPEATVEALDSIEPEQIVILGGPAAVSDDVADELAEYGDVARIGGKDRYATSANIARAYGTNVDTVYVASGENANFADSLSGGALAGTEGVPVLLTRGDRVDPSTADALEFLSADNVVVLGGPAAVSGDVYDAIGADERLSGATRYGTSAAIAAQFPADLEAAYVASGVSFPDALTGAALAGSRGVPTLLSTPSDVPDVVMEELDRVSPAYVGLLGGRAALSQDVEDELNASFPAWAAE